MDRNFQTRRSNETLDFRNRVVTFRFSLSTRDTVRYGHTLGTILGSSSDSGWSIGPIRDSIPLVVVFPLLLSAVPTQHPRIVANQGLTKVYDLHTFSSTLEFLITGISVPFVSSKPKKGVFLLTFLQNSISDVLQLARQVPIDRNYENNPICF